MNSCPEKPNCVSSADKNAKNYIEPIAFSGTEEEFRTQAEQVISQWPRTKIVVSEKNYIRAEIKSAVFGFTDDLELSYDIRAKQIAVRSAARLGYYDFGVNRKRVEKLREELIKE